MNNCRVPLLFSVSLLFFLLIGQRSVAQVVINKAAMQKASQDRALKEAAFQKILTRTALERGWPLTKRNKKGRLAYLRGINSSGLPYYVTTTDNLISAATIRTNKVWPGGGDGLSLNGSTAAMKGKIAVWDEGQVRPTHVELAGRVIQKDNANVLSDHSTHVSGTMIAAGINPLAKGMAFGAQQLLAYDFNDDASEMLAAAAGGLLVSNHSYADIAGWYFDDTEQRWEFWGDPGDTVDIRFGLYDEDARYWDTIAYLAPNYLIAKAGGNNRGDTGAAVGDTYYRMNAQGNFINAGNRPAGISSNTGYNTIATYGNSKNILTLGAVNPIPGGYHKPGDVVLADFSSLGPSGDGRIKPDLVADGVNVLSSISTSDNAYDIYSGTSMATPASAGSSFLLQEYYYKLHNTFMLSSTLKGLLIHTADEAGASPGPDYAFGWGLINMERAAAVITADNGDHSQQIIQGSLSTTTASATYTVTASGKAPVAATICWTDVPGTPATIPANSHNFRDVGIKLVNDLDLRITDNVSNKVYYPWILDPNNPGAAATKGDNIRDNVEKVELSDSLIPGRSYTITVSHKGTIQRTTQTYSLLISGVGGITACASGSTVGSTGANITQVTTGGINNPSPSGTCRSYTDYSALTAAKLPVASTVPVTIVTGNCGATDNSRMAKIYIDFNNDGVFDPTTELAYQSPSAHQANTPFTGSMAIPNTAVAGTYARMRVIVEETTDPTAITPCGTYAAGETQDYKVVFTNPANDVGVISLEYPTQVSCANDSQVVSIRIHNFGSATQAGGIPVTTTITGGASPVVLSAICKDSILSGADVVFTYNTTLATTAGTTYTFISKTGLASDPNTANDSDTLAVTMSPAEAAGTGTATICGANATSVVLHAATTGDVPVWYETATSTTPLAAGSNTSTTVIPSDKTYYLGLNDLKEKAGVPNKMVFTSTSSNQGAYFRFGGNFVMFTTGVPLTIESAKMYIGHSGQMTFTLATLSSLNNNTGEYGYLPLYTTTIDVFATKAVPDSSSQINIPVGDNTDTGATYLLNIPVPNPGNYVIIIDCSPTANAFLNLNINKDPYPLSIPGVFSITGNDFRDYGKADSVTYSHKFYYPFYNLGIRLNGCPAPRTAVTATTEAGPTITLAGNTFTSSAASNNQWYVNDSLLVGHTGQTDSATIPGVYYTVQTDPATGCSLISNKITFTPSGGDANASIGLSNFPNPSTGVFQLQFYMSTVENTSITLTDMLGQRVYEADYPNFSGLFSQQINAPQLASGVYTLRIIHGDKTYHKELLVLKK
ncbi:MAG TPA: S8 family serine peptidase [Puia sp.]|nr:S8 family serine peptidase [Puia sp.]